MPVSSMRSAVTFILVLVTTTLSPAHAERTPLGIRLVFDDGVLPEGKFCTDSEHRLVAHHMYESVARLLDEAPREGNRRRLVNCAKVCRGFGPGACFIGFPECVGYRRSLEEEEDDIISQKLESNYESMSSDFLSMCLEEEHAVLESLRNGVEGVSDACNALLHDKVDVECFDLDILDGDDDSGDIEDQTVHPDEITTAPTMSTWVLTLVCFFAFCTLLASCWHRRKEQAQEENRCDTGEMV